ncbi:MAG: PKD domain-containing protein, partial [Nitrosopumilus sp.]
YVNAINHPPNAIAGPDQTVGESTTVKLNGSGFDPDNDELTYSWSQKSGTPVDMSQTGTSLTFVAPTGVPNKATVMVFELKVADPYGESDTDSLSVSVAADNNGPSANAGPDQEIDENTMMTLSCIGSDPDNDSLSYSWKQISGPTVEMINPNSSELSFTSPTVLETTVLEFECTVTDGELSSTDSVKVTVNNVLNLDIVADAGDDRIVDEDKIITLDGSRSYDPENQPLNYSWVQLTGETIQLSDPASITPTFTSPIVKNGEIKVLTFELTVSDNNGRSASDTVTITVDPINAPPEATVTARQIS